MKLLISQKCGLIWEYLLKWFLLWFETSHVTRQFVFTLKTMTLIKSVTSIQTMFQLS